MQMGLLKKIQTKVQEKHSKRLEKAMKKEAANSSSLSAIANYRGETVFAWVAPEYVEHEKSIHWYLVCGLLALFTAVIALFYDAWTFSLVIVVFCGVYYVNHFEKPKDVSVEISEMSIKIGKKIIPFRNIKAFWIYYLPGHVETLNLLTTDSLFPEISIQLRGQNPVPIRSYLLKQIPEWEGKEETLVEAILRLLKV